MFELRPYQRQAVDRCVAYFKRQIDPAVIVLPTGAGKSLVIAEMARIARGRVLVLAHVKELVEQNHQKFESYGSKAGIYSAGLHKKQSDQKVIFGSIQSVANAPADFFADFSLLVIDECHRVSMDEASQYRTAIDKLRQNNSNLRILGLTATPYRLGLGWIYKINPWGAVVSQQERFFKRCVFELNLSYMIEHRYLTPPVKVDIPVTSYDFSELTQANQTYTTAQVEALIKKQKRLTPLIIKNIIDITQNYHRQGVMIFSSTVSHAREILSYLPDGDAKLIIGDTDNAERDQIIEDFKQKKFTYLVNVSVLTTGFDAPHVDVIAILRPTDSVSLYQQIIGRGLRLHQGKKDCFVLDYTGVAHDIYSPEVGDKKPTRESVQVVVPCPQCNFDNHFWGRVDDDGELLEHYGRKCRGGIFDPETLESKPCGYRFRSKLCEKCGQENDMTAKACSKCLHIMIDADAKLKQARLSKNFHILKPDSIEYESRISKKGTPFLQIKYYDYDAKCLSEYHYFDSATNLKKFNINFLRSHLMRPELSPAIQSIEDLIAFQKLLRMPTYIIARKQEKYWRITEKIFVEDL